MRTPAGLIALPLLAGAVLGTTAPEPPGAGVLAAAALLAAGAALAAFGLDDAVACVLALICGSAASGASLGVTAATRAYAPPLLQWFDARQPDGPLQVDGVLREDAAVTPFGISLIVDAHRVSAADEATRAGGAGPGEQGGLRVTVAGALAAARVDEWRAGRTLRFSGALRRPATYLNPGVRDERRAQARRGVVLVGGVKSASLVELVRHGSWSSEAAADLRARVRMALDRDVGRWSPRSAGIAKAVLIGDRTGLSEDDTRRLQQAGTYHVIAISGGNIAILTLLLLGSLRALRAPPRIAAPSAALALVAYGQVVVPGASVSRAIAAAVLYLGALSLDHRPAPLNLLAVAAVLGVAVSPLQVLDAGFLLSFGATLGILLLASRDSSPGPSATPVRRALGIVVAVSWTTIAAEAALAPVGAVLFSTVTFAGVLLNFAAIPLMTVVQVGALATLGLAAAGLTAVSGHAGWLVHVAAEGIIRSAALAEALPVLIRAVAPPAWWLVAAYYTSGLVLISRWRGRWRPFAAAGALLSAALMVASPAWAGQGSIQPARGVRVVTLDVGQADATLILAPDGRAILVDAGAGPTVEGDDGGAGGFDAGSRVVAPALRALGVRRLEALVITHGDPDHLGGAPAIVRLMRPRAVWEGVPVPTHPGLRALRQAALEVGASWRTVQAGDVESYGGLELRVLHPPPPDWERQRVRNEDSVVLEVRLGEVAVVLPGDIGREGEAAIAAHLQPAPLVVLKAPHHGSATSSSEALLDALAPAAVVFSAGRPSRYGHPAPAVVDRYRRHGAALFSTADLGAVFIDTDGRALSVWGWAGGRRTWSLNR